MKKLILIIMFLSNILTVVSQTYSGYFNDNYAGVQGVLKNPASIVDSRFKTDINLFSISASLGNDLFGVDALKVFSDTYNFEDDSSITPTKNNNAILNIDIMLPSVMFNIAPKHSLSIFTRSRTIANFVGLNGSLYDELRDDVDVNNSFTVNGGDFNVVASSWGEIGLSYAAVILQNKQHFLKGGLTFKYLQGGVNTYSNANDLKVVYTENEQDEGQSTITTEGTITYGGSQDFEGDSQGIAFEPKSYGYGFDLGFVYEWRPNYSKYDVTKANQSNNNFKGFNKYKLRLGVSVLDIGSIKYKDAVQDKYNLNGTITKDEFESVDNLFDLLNTYYTKIETANVSNANLPTALHIEVDWNIKKNFYLNLNGDFGLVDKKKVNGNTIENSISVVPRFETRVFTFFVPISAMQFSGTQIGSGFRLGPLFVGSSTVLTNLFSEKSKAVDFYMGVKIPVYQKKVK